MEKSPRAELRYELKKLRTGSESGNELLHVKSEVYAIAAYFIEKAVTQAVDWVENHPNQGLRYQQHTVESSTVQSSVIEVNDIREYLASANVGVVLRNIGFLIEGLLHHHIKQVMNADSPAPLVNPEDEHIQERLRSLLEQEFRDGGDYRAQDFVLSAARAPAVFIPTMLHSALAGYHREFGRLPTDDELTEVTEKMTPLLLKLSQFNVQDVVAFMEEHFGVLGARNGLQVNVFDDILFTEKTAEGFQFSFPEIQEYKSQGTAEEPTVGCPAVYGRVENQNIIRFFIDYAVSLLKESGVYHSVSKS